MFKSIEKLKEINFEGFKSIKELKENIDLIPQRPGVYLVLNLNQSVPEFLAIGTGGHFKSKNPNKDLNYLKAKWINDTHVVYIGKAGGNNNSTLRSRLKLYLDFGNGKPVGHYGGRLIWQLAHSPNLIICWKVLNDENPRDVEKQLILDFSNQFGSKPFANINS
ncbi:hypothetical protein AAFN85_07890 [Mucilaginibacter sp. CAU 1740]|uniref:hypothetical protein n=1 Tax=Mucilaginibacter sp. CAU 1740 TaxID=3140365 RepID=UPI00325BF0F3